MRQVGASGFMGGPGEEPRGRGRREAGIGRGPGGRKKTGAILSTELPTDRDRNEFSVVIRPVSEGRFVLDCPGQMEWRARGDLVGLVAGAVGGESIRELIVSFKGVNYIDSAGVGAIFSLRKYLMQRGAKMVICGASPIVERLFDTINLPKLIPLVSDLQAAYALLEQDEHGQ